MAEIDDSDGLFGNIEHFAHSERGDPVGAQFTQNAPALDVLVADVEKQQRNDNDSGALAEEADSHDEVFDIAMKEHASQHVGENPQCATDTVGDEEAPTRHADNTCHGHADDTEARNKFGKVEGGATAFGKRGFGGADTSIGFDGQATEQAQHRAALIAADFVPGVIGENGGHKRSEKGEDEVVMMIANQGTHDEQERIGGNRQAEADAKQVEEYEVVSVEEQELGKGDHG